MNIQMAAFVFGCLLLFVALLGGGFEIKELKVPKVGRASRLASCVLGMVFIFIGFSPALAGALPGIPAGPEPQPTPPLAQPAATETTVVATESRPAVLSTQVPAPDLRPTTEPAPKPRVSRPATAEPEKPSLKEKAQKKAKKMWGRVW